MPITKMVKAPRGYLQNFDSAQFGLRGFIPKDQTKGVRILWSTNTMTAFFDKDIHLSRLHFPDGAKVAFSEHDGTHELKVTFKGGWEECCDFAEHLLKVI